MSVAEPFKFRGPDKRIALPFCVPRKTEAEIAAICVDFFGTDEVAPRLTGDRAFVERLYWNLETISFRLEGLSYYESYAVDTTLTAFVAKWSDFTHDGTGSGATASTPPVNRVCPDPIGLYAQKVVIEEIGTDHEYGVLLSLFPYGGTVFYNTTTGQYNMIFDFGIHIGEISASTSSDGGDGTITITLFGQSFTLFLNLNGGIGLSHLTVSDFTPAYFTYLPAA